MSIRASDPASSAAMRSRTLLTPHGLALLLMWVVVTGVLALMLVQGVRYTDRLGVARHVLHAGYVAALLWYLGRAGPAIGKLPRLRPSLFPRWRYGPWIPVLGITLMLMLTAFSDDGVGIMMLLLIVTTVWLLIGWRRDIRWRAVVQGLAVALIAYLAGLPAVSNGMIGETTFYGLLIFVPPMYVVGGLLHDRTRLGGIQLRFGRYGETVRSVLWGCLLFVPLGLINALDGSPGSDITWVTEWWMPLSLPWFSGIAEETWFRLLLVGLCYFLLRPAFRKRPALAVVGAALFSAITFGLGHGRTVEKLLTTGLLYGFPMAVVFARRDWEHAVGAHYMINLIPWLMVFLET